MTDLLVYIISFLSIQIINGELKVCKYSNMKGICIPEEDCYGKAVKSSLTCGRNICCLDPPIIKQKCHEYWEEIHQSINYTSHELINSTTFKIIGGQSASRNEFPHMVAIGFEKNKQGNIDWSCGGTLISPNFILSAAHCFDQKVLMTWAFLGSSSLDDPEGVLRPVPEVINHPKYNKWEFHSDIALLRMESSLVFSPELHPACILLENEQFEVTSAIATGWGQTEKVARKGSRELQQVELDLFPLADCKKYFPTFVLYNIFVPSMMCAGFLAGGRDTCQGDSGGPLAISLESKPHLYGLIGITSTGDYSCGEKNSLGIYTKVAYYATWITSVVWPKETKEPKLTLQKK